LYSFDFTETLWDAAPKTPEYDELEVLTALVEVSIAASYQLYQGIRRAMALFNEAASASDRRPSLARISRLSRVKSFIRIKEGEGNPEDCRSVIGTSSDQEECLAEVIIAKMLWPVDSLKNTVERTSAGLVLADCLSVKGKGTLTMSPGAGLKSEVSIRIIVLHTVPFGESAFNRRQVCLIERGYLSKQHQARILNLPNDRIA
jgi:hypothetical protein